MSTTLRVEISDEMKARLEAAIVQANKFSDVCGAPQCTLADIVRGSLAKGLDMPPNTPPEQVPLVALSLGQFAQLTGLGDLAAARASAAKVRAEQQAAEDGIRQMFADVKNVQGIHAPIRLKSPAEVESWSKGVQHGIVDKPALTIVLCYAVVNEAAGGMPMPTPQGSN
jgi:hypothetical protein